MRGPMDLLRTSSGCLLGAFALTAMTAFPAIADEVVQIDVTSILNTRSVTTLTDGKIVPWILGLDNNGAFSGYMTNAAARFAGDPDPKALPDSGVFPAQGILPGVVLNYSNADARNNQTRYLMGLGSFSFEVPRSHYLRLFLFLTLGEGAYNQKGTPNLRVSLHYTDGTVSSEYLIMDYAAKYPVQDPNFCNLVSDRSKWKKDGAVAELGNHNIHALNVHPDAKRILRSIHVEKTRKEVQYPKRDGYLLFWGATGVIGPASREDSAVKASH